jgi:glucose-6-phosphate dehydrogenase assembly protein OpcA
MAVNAAQIEKELTEMWKHMRDPQKEKEHQLLRTCVLNLTVYAPGERSEDAVTKVLADVSVQHPSRIVVMLPDPAAKENSLSAWVNTLCHAVQGGRQQVCCEEIMVRALGTEVSQLPSLVRSLQVSDLPAVLWWRGNLELSHPLFTELIEVSDRIIVDSSTLSNPELEFGSLHQLIQKEKEWTAFSDVDWARLTPWRSAISGFFDVPEYRDYLNKIERVEIECERTTEADNLPGQAFLIAGWIASRLNWTLRSKPSRVGQDRYSMELTSDKGPISIRLHSRQTGKKMPGIYRISLFEEDDPTIHFAVTRSEDGVSLKTNVELSGKQRAARIIRYDPENETMILSKELEILHHDIVYEQAIAFVASLQNAERTTQNETK